jgi:hypothetical protein
MSVPDTTTTVPQDMMSLKAIADDLGFDHVFDMEDLMDLPYMLLRAVRFAFRLAIVAPTQIYSLGVIATAFALFLLLICPLPGFYHIGQFLVKNVLGARISGFSIGRIIAGIALFFFAFQCSEWYTLYGDLGARACVPAPGMSVHEATHWKTHCRGSRWRRERNMYMNGLAAVLYLSLDYIAQLLQKRQQRQLKRD